MIKTKYSGLPTYLCKLRISDENGQNKLLKDLSRRINSLSITDLQQLLEFLNIIDNAELEVKLFSLLSVCLAANESYYETIATNNPLYAKLECILSKGLPLATTTVLNFISTLLYTSDAEEARRDLATHARNHIRVSGCLRVMGTLFVNSMMFPDTWQALCKCLAECCRDSQLNKTHCTYLIPSCVQKCLNGYSDVLIVLQSILSGHPKNVQTFVDNDGIKIFNRQMLQYITCLQLLSAVVKSSEKAASIVCTSDVPSYLAEILQWNRADTQKGQWCKIIVHYLESHGNVSSRIQNKATELRENVHNEKETTLVSLSNVNSKNDVTRIQRDNEDEIDGPDDTANLYRNVFKEILYWKTQDNLSNRPKPMMQAFGAPASTQQLIEGNQKTASVQRTSSVFTMEKSMITRSMIGNLQEPQSKVRIATNHGVAQRDTESELSFSFLKEERPFEGKPTLSAYNCQFEEPQPFMSIKTTQYINHKDTDDGYSNAITIADKSVQTNFDLTPSVNVEDDKSSINSRKFKPTVISTPKRREQQKRASVNDMQFPKTAAEKKRTTSCNVFKLKHRELRKRTRHYKEKPLPVTKLTSKSVSARFLHAINESCTTFVKTVKDVFTPWKTATANKDSTKSSAKTNNAAKSGYSFTDYMTKRDEILGVDSTTLHNDENHYKNNPCKTCNDTEILKHKLASDAYLSKTVNKLKLGINLFGCDFKKISKTFWPNDNYMTPSVLYNLYRKLILK